MNTETIIPANESEWLALRTKDITSTDVAALFGLSPYCTLFELWHRKKNLTSVDFEATEWVKWGQRLQDSIAAGVAEDNGWVIRRMSEYVRIPELRIGASFDFSIETEYERPSETFEKGLLEIKNVDSLAFRD